MSVSVVKINGKPASVDLKEYIIDSVSVSIIVSKLFIRGPSDLFIASS